MEKDSRLTNQEEYLKGVTLFKKNYARYSEDWDHDHCAFCWTKFAEKDSIPDALHQGYTTKDEQHWICEECFQDFKETFSWKVIDKTS
jgi:hypothetical protein